MSNEALDDGIDQVVRVLVPLDPRRQAQKVLAHLCAETLAHTGAVFSTSQNDRLDLRYTVGSIDQVVLDQAHAGWRAARKELEAGQWWEGLTTSEPVGETARACLLEPLSNGACFVGLLYLDFLAATQREASDRRMVTRIGRILAACLTAPGGLLHEDDLSSHLARSTARELRHAQLLAHLAATGGNIKQVARRMGKSRPTIYAWMDEFGIPRRRESRLRRA